MEYLKIIALGYIFVRSFIDVLGFLMLGVKDQMVGWGWPIDSFWMGTVRPVPIVMFLSTLSVLLGAVEIELVYTLMMTVIPIFWAALLIKDAKSSKMMKVDAVSWILVALSAILLIV